MKIDRRSENKISPFQIPLQDGRITAAEARRAAKLVQVDRVTRVERKEIAQLLNRPDVFESAKARSPLEKLL